LAGIDKIFNMKKMDKSLKAEVKDVHLSYKKENLTDEERAIITKEDEKTGALLSAHLLLPEGSRVVDTGCDEGKRAFVLAKLNPRAHFIGVDADSPDIEFANKHYKLPNLSFVQSDLAIEKLEDETLDAVINSNILHGVYSRADYNPDAVSELLQQQVAKLKVGGTMLIRDYMMPLQEEMVLLELPKIKSEGKTPDKLSDADLLLLFSQHARPLPGGECEGFFIEELPARTPDTRLFRLPHKWALEFIYRKDDRYKWDKQIKTEFTFFNYYDYRREFAKMGMRTIFSAPYWSSDIVEARFKGKFRMYHEDGTPMRSPATSYYLVAQKTSSKKSMVIQEKRASQKPAGDLQITVVRDAVSGKVTELVNPKDNGCDIIPFRITPDNRMIVYINSGYPRPIINAVPRGNNNLDEKQWSGHLIEPISMSNEEMQDDADYNRDLIFEFVRKKLGLRPKSENSWYVGDTYFPDPEKIDAAIEPVFVEVENPYKTSWEFNDEIDTGFIEKGRIVELDGTDIIAASQVGMLPEPKLEMYLLDLFHNYGIELPEWVADNLPEVPKTKIEPVDPNELLKEANKKTFVVEKTPAKYLKTVRSIFVEDGTVGSTTRGLAAKDVEFVITQDGVENIAVVLPLCRDFDEKLMVMLEPEIMTVPNRRGGDGAMLNVPSFKLPKDVLTIDDAREFVAQKFSVPVDKVTQLGESYFSHVGVMPQRVYPFMVASDRQPDEGTRLKCCLMNELVKMKEKKFPRMGRDAMKTIARVQMRMDPGHEMRVKNDYAMKYKGFALATEKIAIDARKTRQSVIPSVVMGEVKKHSLKATIKNVLDIGKPKPN